jgi:hypothetical protein
VDGPDQLQLELRKRLLDLGDFYLTTTNFRGRRWLRLALMNPATELADIRLLVAEIRELAGRLDLIQGPGRAVSAPPGRTPRPTGLRCGRCAPS